MSQRPAIKMNLRDWHDQAPILWVSCKQSPCAVIPVGVR